MKLFLISCVILSAAKNLIIFHTMKKFFIIILLFSVCGNAYFLVNNLLAQNQMKRVTGLGGIFFKVDDPAKTKEWYQKHLGLKTDEYGATFEWRKTDNPDSKGFTAWSPFKNTTKYFEPSKKDYMINYRVENLEELVKTLKSEGVEVVDEIETYDYGKFVHIMDIDGNKIELWEPLGQGFEGNTTY